MTCSAQLLTMTTTHGVFEGLAMRAITARSGHERAGG